ncbi:hypothetical protein CLV88_11775 [Shimia abyssi]|uniref:Uncharacterized protein n=1 Tax=Shimia abyssi TaxID=1662395 RepID=A0A2P8F729_9RHOB|nr:hypothetical protein CLV88_11775 [Shimia abyssi]
MRVNTNDPRFNPVATNRTGLSASQIRSMSKNRKQSIVFSLDPTHRLP